MYGNIILYFLTGFFEGRGTLFPKARPEIASLTKRAVRLSVITWGVKKIINSLSENQEIKWQKLEGNLVSGMTYKNITLEDLKWFPTPNILKIQSLAVNIDSIGLEGVTVGIENARLTLPNSDPILFHGKMDKQILDINFFSNSNIFINHK